MRTATPTEAAPPLLKMGLNSPSLFTRKTLKTPLLHLVHCSSEKSIDPLDSWRAGPHSLQIHRVVVPFIELVSVLRWIERVSGCAGFVSVVGFLCCAGGGGGGVLLLLCLGGCCVRACACVVLHVDNLVAVDRGLVFGLPAARCSSTSRVGAVDVSLGSSSDVSGGIGFLGQNFVFAEPVDPRRQSTRCPSRFTQ
ncbi:hypothetical protein U9M48_029833 [Paspalum notatum var. saurae]|uniref:Uncharacterized protein n=1 Tax=Paspalum notatum var. saurae TaxID=547442 RepID=A0AAQ3X2M2_PASNO